MEKQFLRDDIKHDDRGFGLGVALSGGGARGLAHAGALKAIEDAGLKIDCIAGVSAGSIVAVLYAAGVKPESILEMFTCAGFFDLADLSVGKGGLLKIDKFINYVMRCLGKYKRIEDLRIPTYIGVTNFDEACPEVFCQGDIAPIIQASCSIPVAVVPVVINGTTYVDGGVLRNLPAWTIRDKCHKLIGISVSTVVPKKTPPTILGMAMRSYSLLAKSNQAQDLEICDMALKLDELAGRNVFDLRGLEQVYQIGYNDTKKALTQLNI